MINLFLVPTGIEVVFGSVPGPLNQRDKNYNKHCD